MNETERATPSLTVVTAALNAGDQLLGLADALAQQSDRNFRWVVADGLSSDGSIERLNERKYAWCTVLRERDFGIYDALNRGVRASQTTHYVVLGADDRPDPLMIANYRQLVAGGTGIGAARVRHGKATILPGQGRPWLRAHRAYVAHHSVGVAICKELHLKHGYYSKRFPIAADQYFILRACQDRATVVRYGDFTAGTFGVSGLSSTDSMGALCEIFRIQLELQQTKLVQILLFSFRIWREYFRQRRGIGGRR